MIEVQVVFKILTVSISFTPKLVNVMRETKVLILKDQQCRESIILTDKLWKTIFVTLSLKTNYYRNKMSEKCFRKDDITHIFALNSDSFFISLKIFGCCSYFFVQVLHKTKSHSINSLLAFVTFFPFRF